MPKKRKSPNGASSPRAGKRKIPPAKGAVSRSKKRRKSEVAPALGGSSGEKFYYCEGHSNDPQKYFNLLIQKRLVRPFEAAPRTQSAPFEYRSGTDVSGNLYRSHHGSIEADESNLLVGGLNQRELEMWSSYVGAEYAARGFPPCNIARKLGTITRQILLPWDSSKKENKIPLDAPYHPMHEKMTKTMKKQTPYNEKAKPPSLSKLQKELQTSEPMKVGETEEERKLRLASIAKALVRSWGESAKIIGKILPNWNQYGEIPSVPVIGANPIATDEDVYSKSASFRSSRMSSSGTSNPPLRTASVTMIRNMLESKLWCDDDKFAPSEKDFWHLKIPTDTLSVLEALEALAKPDPNLYSLPLVVTIPILEPAKNPSTEPSPFKAFQLTISVYAHRLLFECMTANSFRIVMASLDDDTDGSCVVRPLVKSPAVGPKVFGKDPETKVEILELDDQDGSQSDESIAMDESCPQTRTSDTLDAFSTEGFLKLIENQGVSGVDSIYKGKIEPVLYKKNNPLLQVSLLPHQIHGVCWMYQMETLDDGGNPSSTHPSLGLNGLLWEQRRFYEGDTYYYSPALGQARLRIGEGRVNGKRRQARRGGILADEMGLGKTVQALALVLATLEDLRKEKETKQNDEYANSVEACGKESYKKYSHATLIIVPPALAGQWMNEIQKIAGENLLVQFFDYKDKNYNVGLNPSADIVLTTYQTLESNGKKAFREFKFSSTIWGRIILDEMQEVRSWNTTISKTCQELESTRRWMLSGTPLWEGIQDFKGELCFLGLEPFAANNEDGFFNFAIANHWNARSKHGLEILRILGLVMLRRTKSMSILKNGLPLLGLKKLTLVFEPVPQDPAERAMYCFLESVMHSMIEISDSTKNKQNKMIFLRLLRELCVSSYLINGGLGCNSQLSVLNRLMKVYNRLQVEKQNQVESVPSTLQQGNNRFYSCDEAIQFLSQVEDMARTDSDFVTDIRVGGGGGISRRTRALLINPQEEIGKARDQIARSAEICKKARSSRAKAWWQWALEGVTTGRLKDRSCYDTISPSVVALWNWRYKVTCEKPTKVLSVLDRGFRPTQKYFGLSTVKRTEEQSDQQGEREWKLVQLGKRRTEFRWAHPYAFSIMHIPIQVSDEQLKESMEGGLSSGFSLPSTPPQIIRMQESTSTKTRDVIVQFFNKHDFDCFERSIRKVDGVKLNIQEKSPLIEEEIAAAKTKYHEAEAMFKVFPCEANERNLAKAKSAYKKSKLGLRILDKASYRDGQVLCSRAFGNFRGSNPKTWSALFQATLKQVEESTAQITEHEITVKEQEKRIKSMERKIKLNVAGSGVENLNTIDGLQALKNGEADKTNCPICFDNLGESSNGHVALTRCGHMSCKSCLKKWMDQKEAEGMTVSCIECRKPIRFNQLIFVDPNKVEKEKIENRKKEAHVLVRQAAKMLEENYGKLEPHLWEALYLVIDLPSGIDRNHHNYYTAIPGLFLGHLRHAMGNCLPIDSKPNQVRLDPNMEIPLPSKFRALLADLPRDELSVVFASSKSIVLHLQYTLEREGFGCKTLFVGQSEKESESAVSDWESYSSGIGSKNTATVLVVQAGVAACGLTLTAASKMFIIEPFRKHEEEKQAYARLHRFGQKKAVSCKVYFTPVSVESRLLEWRRRAKAHAPKEEKTIYAPLRNSNIKSDEDDGVVDHTSAGMIDGGGKYESDGEDQMKENFDSTDNDEAVAEENETRFLLGLTSSSAEADTSLGSGEES